MTSHAVNAIAQRFNLGPVNQIAFVVRSIERSLPFYEAIFGKFQIYETSAEVTYRGRPIKVRLKTALTQPDPVQIELCEAVGDGPPHGDYLRRHGEGLYHVRFTVENLQATVQTMAQAGFVQFYSGDMKSVRFAYLELSGDDRHIVIELLEPVPAATRAA